MPNILKLGISSCLLDNCVRYDGGHRLDLHVKQTLGRIVGWVAVCPEVECGLGVPREPMRLVDDRKEIRLETIDSRQDKTGIFSLWLPQKLKELESTGQAGFVLKARSPSCGVRDTALFDPYGREKGRGAGLFASALLKKWPSLPLVDEGSLHDPRKNDEFKERMLTYNGGESKV